MRFFSGIGKSSRLEEIELEVVFGVSCDELVDWSAWEGVDCILAGADFKFLRKVDIELLSTGGDPELFEETCGNLGCSLPLLGAKGVLGYVYRY